MSEFVRREYKGDGMRHYTELEGAVEKQEVYIAAEPLAEAVNTALYLGRPLLLEGDPGCGKTRLAYAVAYELGYSLKECYIRSTSRAQDLLYSYDAIDRLYDIQEQNFLRGERKQLPRKKYVTLGKLGEAIELAQKDIPSVVLIDEIDKADIDFPNDLLLVLDRMWFEVEEVKDWRIDALNGQEREERRDFLPLFIITSNREKELPKAFLRRCLFYYIDFPNRSTLDKIVERHFPKTSAPLLSEATKRFWQIRQNATLNLRKPPSTSELLDWIRALERDTQNNKITVEKLSSVPLRNLPHLEILIKTQSDLITLSKVQDG